MSNNQLVSLSLIVSSRERMIQFGKILGLLARPQMVIALNGDLGAGKTTLTKGIGQALGVDDTINSPTFTIMKIYQTKNLNIPYLYHLDVYRTEGSASDFDLEEFFYYDGLTVIEWAKMIEDLIPEEAIDINIKITSPDERVVFISTLDREYLKQLKIKLVQGGFLDD